MEQTDFPGTKYKLPLNFPAKNLFPYEWPSRDIPNAHKTPSPYSEQWRVIVDFRESALWKEGDLQMFANYFGVHHTVLSKKVNHDTTLIHCKYST